MEVKLQVLNNNVAILHLGNNENRLTLDYIDELNRALDTVEKSESIVALITIGDGKFYSNGVDLQWAQQQLSDGNLKTLRRFSRECSKLVARLLTFPMPTIAAMNGKSILLLVVLQSYK